MKLVFCTNCNDVFNLVSHELRRCACGKSKGKYLDNIKAEISKGAIPIGIHNSSFLNAIIARPNSGMGKDFIAFVIPKKVDSIIYTVEGE